jgi:uncharacterized protein YjbI with pentapeptide repeats
MRINLMDGIQKVFRFVKSQTWGLPRRVYERYWERRERKLLTNRSKLPVLQSPNLGVPPPPVAACHHSYVGSNTYCARKLLEGSNYCFWHHRSIEKYELSVIAQYFGAELSLKQAIQAEVRSGNTLSGAYLEGAQLGGNWFTPGADLSNADLSAANLRGAWISYGKLRGANLALSNLEHSGLGGADLRGCTLTRTRLFEAKFRNNDFSQVKGLTMECFRGTSGHFFPHCRMLEQYPDQAEPMYRALVAYFSGQGALDDASWAAYRGRLMRHLLLRKKLSFMTCRIEAMIHLHFVGGQITPRRLFETAASAWSRNLPDFMKSWLFWFVFGYGEKPLRVALVSGSVMLAYAAMYTLCHVLDEPGIVTALYFSIVTFTTLGYGDLKPRYEFRLLAASEAVIGLLLSGMFLFTLARRAVGRA